MGLPIKRLATLLIWLLLLGCGPVVHAQQSPSETVTYAAGWNLVGAPSATTFAEAIGPLYSLNAEGTGYGIVPTVTRLPAGIGYWAYFAEPTEKTLSNGNSEPISGTAPAGQFIMIGNPFLIPATVHGADAVFIYDPVQGYELTSTIPVGQGAFAYSAAGATVTITPGP